MEQITTKELIASFQEKLNEVNRELLQLKQTEEAERKELALLKQEYTELAEYAADVVSTKDCILKRNNTALRLSRRYILALIDASWVKVTDDGGKKGWYAAEIIEKLKSNVEAEFDRAYRQMGIVFEGEENEASRVIEQSKGNR